MYIVYRCKNIHKPNSEIRWMEEVLHQLVRNCPVIIPLFAVFHTYSYQLVQDFATIHSMSGAAMVVPATSRGRSY